MKIAVVVPVHPKESLQIVKNSFNALKKLRSKIPLEFIYLLDGCNGKDKARWLQEKDLTLLRRKSPGGWKAGAINFVLKKLKLKDRADYIAIFDVDMRPDIDFLLDCWKALKNEERAFIATGLTYALNDNENLVTKLGGVKFEISQYIQRISNHFGIFLPIGGPMGLIRADLIKRFNEKVLCEDIDFLIRMYLAGRKAILTEKKSNGSRAMVGLHVPLNISDWLSQHQRWIAGGFEAIKEVKGNIGLAIGILSACFPAFFIPLIPLYMTKLSGCKALIKPFLAFLLVTLISFCSASVLAKKILGKEIGWKIVSHSKKENFKFESKS